MSGIALTAGRSSPTQVVSTSFDEWYRDDQLEKHANGEEYDMSRSLLPLEVEGRIASTVTKSTLMPSVAQSKATPASRAMVRKPLAKQIVSAFINRAVRVTVFLF